MHTACFWWNDLRMKNYSCADMPCLYNQLLICSAILQASAHTRTTVDSMYAHARTSAHVHTAFVVRRYFVNYIFYERWRHQPCNIEILLIQYFAKDVATSCIVKILLIQYFAKGGATNRRVSPQGGVYNLYRVANWKSGRHFGPFFAAAHRRRG